MRAPFWLLCSLSLVFTSSTAYAQDWAATFPGATLRAQLPAVKRVVVVAAGANTTEVEPAAGAFEAGARGAMLELVMSDDALGNVSADDDSAIVLKAQALPVDAIAVVRVFPSEPPVAPSVVIIVYDKQGTVLKAFNGRAGEALSGPSGSAGAEAKAMEAVANITQASSTTSTQAQTSYDQRYVWFADKALVNANTGHVLKSWSEPMRGKYRERLNWPNFYKAVGRDDLAREYSQNRRVKRRRIIAAIPVLAVGAGLGVWGLFDALVGVETDECEVERYRSDGCITYKREKRYGVLAAAVPFVAGGTTLLVLGLSKRVQPVKAPEARRLADEHNQKLRTELGLPNEDVTAQAPATRPEKPERTLALTPRFSPQAGSLSLSLTF